MRRHPVNPLAVSAFLCFVVVVVSGLAPLADLTPEAERIARAAFLASLIGALLFDNAYLTDKRERDRND